MKWQSFPFRAACFTFCATRRWSIFAKIYNVLYAQTDSPHVYVTGFERGQWKYETEVLLIITSPIYAHVYQARQRAFINKKAF